MTPDMALLKTIDVRGFIVTARSDPILGVTPTVRPTSGRSFRAGFTSSPGAAR